MFFSLHSFQLKTLHFNQSESDTNAYQPISIQHYYFHPIKNLICYKWYIYCQRSTMSRALHISRSRPCYLLLWLLRPNSHGCAVVHTVAKQRVVRTNPTSTRLRWIHGSQSLISADSWQVWHAALVSHWTWRCQRCAVTCGCERHWCLLHWRRNNSWLWQRGWWLRLDTCC